MQCRRATDADKLARSRAVTREIKLADVGKRTEDLDLDLVFHEPSRTYYRP